MNGSLFAIWAAQGLRAMATNLSPLEDFKTPVVLRLREFLSTTAGFCVSTAVTASGMFIVSAYNLMLTYSFHLGGSLSLIGLMTGPIALLGWIAAVVAVLNALLVITMIKAALMMLTQTPLLS